ncbi:MAG: hypothetical protein IAE86_20710 [Burkholderiaceae bacterium]|nr:hypothetical protein [Burkholderiaceae bacterium]
MATTHRFRLRYALLGSIAASSLLLAACGGGGDDGAGLESAASTEERQSALAIGDEAMTWTKIAGEGGSFTVAANTVVRYGVGSSWIQKTVSGTGWCTNGFFGKDPAVGVTKQCQVQMDVTPPPSGTWTKIANEGGSFSVGTSQRVRFGKDTKWVEKTMSGAGQCTNGFFGIDPAYGVTKQCDLFKADAPPPPPPPDDPKYVPPILISKGGTYSANWESQDPKVAAVTVSTTEPVVIQNCRLRGKGHLVLALRDSTNITVRNCIGQGLNPNVVNIRTGRFVSAYKPATLVVERNTMLGTAGIYADGAGASAKGITVRYNRAQNIEGRLSDGKGGYLNTVVNMQFLQLNNVRATKNIEVAWNQVINEPGKSRVEENINLYLTSGTSDSPIRIHDNYIQGAYGADPMAPNYSGGGMIVDGGTSDPKAAAGWVRMYNNQIVGTQNQGIAIAAGHDIDVRNNRLIGSGLLPDGRRMPSANVGVYVSNSYGVPATFYNIVVTANTVGWINNAGKLNNFWFPGCSGSNCQGNYALPAPITLAMESAEFASWNSKLQANGIVIGSSLE